LGGWVLKKKKGQRYRETTKEHGSWGIAIGKQRGKLSKKETKPSSIWGKKLFKGLNGREEWMGEEKNAAKKRKKAGRQEGVIAES